MMDLRDEMTAESEPESEPTAETRDLKSELKTWPIQLKLLNPNAPYLKNADLVIASDCVPFAYPNFHERFLKGKVLLILCPKLDSNIEAYVDKLAEILKNQNIKSITIVHMEVACCFGIKFIMNSALKKAGKNADITSYKISIYGDILQ